MSLDSAPTPTSVAVGPDYAPHRPASPRVRRLRLPRGWALYLMLPCFPIGWLLGLGALVIPVLAGFLAIELIGRRRRLRFPTGSLLFGVFLVWVLASGTMLNLQAPGTVDGDATARLAPFTLRFVNYVSAGVVFLYVANVTERELPRARIIAMQAVFFVEVIILGLLGVIFPKVNFDAPLSNLLPSALSDSAFFSQKTKLSFAQLQDFLGYPAPRPAAPFAYTNLWGEVTSILGVWFIVWGISTRDRRRRLFTVAFSIVAAIPVIYSLNRGMWGGIALGVGLVLLRMLVRGHVLKVAVGTLGLGIAGALLVVSPLATTIQDRIDHPHSNDARTSVSEAAIRGALGSPVLGYGSTRDVEGSANSITVGRSADCAKCGNAAIGGAGHLWLVMFSQGFVGVLIYISVFLRCVWVYRRDDTVEAVAGRIVLLMGLVYMVVYGHVGMPLVLYLIAAALMYRARVDQQPYSVGINMRPIRLTGRRFQA